MEDGQLVGYQIPQALSENPRMRRAERSPQEGTGSALVGLGMGTACAIMGMHGSGRVSWTGKGLVMKQLGNLDNMLGHARSVAYLDGTSKLGSYTPLMQRWWSAAGARETLKGLAADVVVDEFRQHATAGQPRRFQSLPPRVAQQSWAKVLPGRPKVPQVDKEHQLLLRTRAVQEPEPKSPLPVVQ